MLVSTAMCAVTGQHSAISLITSTASRNERPCPPYAVGMVMPTKPACVSAVTMSQGYCSCASISAARGRTTSSANARARACSASWSADSPRSMTPRAGLALDHVLPAIGGKRRSGDEAGVVGGEEHDAARDLLGLAEAPGRDQRQDILVEHVLRHRLHHLGRDVAGADRIHRDAALGAFLRQRLGEAEIARLGGRVVGLAHLALLAVDRG